MSIVNKARSDAYNRSQQAHGLMQQAVSLNSILQSPEYINSVTIDRTYANNIASSILTTFDTKVSELRQYDALLNTYNNRQLSLVDHAPLLQLDQNYILWCDNFTAVITPAIMSLVEYIQPHLGVQ